VSKTLGASVSKILGASVCSLGASPRSSAT
jgi:hypothetical protein